MTKKMTPQEFLDSTDFDSLILETHGFHGTGDLMYEAFSVTLRKNSEERKLSQQELNSVNWDTLEYRKPLTKSS